MDELKIVPFRKIQMNHFDEAIEPWVFNENSMFFSEKGDGVYNYERVYLCFSLWSKTLKHYLIVSFDNERFESLLDQVSD